MSEQCPAGCGRTRDRGHLLCLADVTRTWRAYRTRKLTMDMKARLAIARTYQDASDAAINSARERHIQKELKA